jgi:Chloroplast import apparatus Tic20-like
MFAVMGSAFVLPSGRILSRPSSSSSTPMTMSAITMKGRLTVDKSLMSDNKKDPKAPPKEMKEGLGWFLEELEKADKDPKKSGKPPLYEPGPYPYRLLAALPYLVPIADAFDLGKYMFEAYPESLAAYSALFGPVAGIYNGVPFLPFVVFFLLSYVARAPTFPVEVRFHAAQAFMLSIVQFVPSLIFPFLEKAGVPGMAVLFNSVFLWVMTSSVFMQLLLINPVSTTKNPFVINIVGWSLKYMGYSPDPSLKR